MVQSSPCLASSPAAPLRLRLFGWLPLRTPLRAPGVPRIDPDSLPDYLKRDLGFADGRGAQPRDPQRD